MQGMLTDFLGMTLPILTYCTTWYANDRVHAIRKRQCDRRAELASGAELQTAWPVVSEEYIEYVDVLEAVLQYSREVRKHGRQHGRPFAFVELGAGYGHWTMSAHQALRQLEPDALHRYLLVDTQATLGPFLQAIARNHSVPQQAVQFHAGKVLCASGSCSAGAGRRLAARAGGIDWGQRKWLTEHGAWEVAQRAKESPPVRLRELLLGYKMPCVLDLVDIDIDRGEYQMFADPDTVLVLTQRAQRVHLGLHDFSRRRSSRGGGGAGNDPMAALVSDASRNEPIIAQFRAHGWKVQWLYPSVTPHAETEWGPVAFGDGVASLLNVNFSSATARARCGYGHPAAR